MVTHWILVVFFVLWAAMMWAGTIYVFRRAWGPYFRSKRQPKVRLRATVVAKQGRQELNPVTWEPEFTQKVLVFDCEDGIERDYEVHDDLYDWIDEGDAGELIFQGDLFVSFESRRMRENLDAVYDRMTRG